MLLRLIARLPASKRKKRKMALLALSRNRDPFARFGFGFGLVAKKFLFLQQVELLSRKKKEEPVVSFRVRLLDAGVDAVNVTTVVSFKAGVVIL